MHCDCLACGSNIIEVLYKEEIDCPSCSDIFVIDYIICERCGCCWKEINGKMLKDSFTNPIPHISLEEVVETIETIMGKIDDVPIHQVYDDPIVICSEDFSKKSLCDYIHTCIKCHALSYYQGNGKFQCSECGFRWEINSDK